MGQVQVEYSLPAGDGTERLARAWARAPLVPEPTRTRALGPIERMLAFVAEHPQRPLAPAHGFVPHLGSA